MTAILVDTDPLQPSQGIEARQASQWRVADVTLCLLALPVFVLAAFLLLILNPIGNRGALFYVQWRMGRFGQPFRIVKFRTMRDAGAPRPHDAPLETGRITALGAWLRRCRIDELPQIINVLRGDMSLIGPRPDAWEHAQSFLQSVPDYARRHSVRPGITGLAQVELGYAEGLAATAQKVRLDLDYIRRKSWRLDLLILWRTTKVVAAAGGR